MHKLTMVNSVVLTKCETFHKRPLFREPCAMKAASTVLTGGLGRRTERQRALILPTGTAPLTYLARDVSQSMRNSFPHGGVTLR